MFTSTEIIIYFISAFIVLLYGIYYLRKHVRNDRTVMVYELLIFGCFVFIPIVNSALAVAVIVIVIFSGSFWSKRIF